MNRRASYKVSDENKDFICIHKDKGDKPSKYTPNIDLDSIPISDSEYWISLMHNTSILYKNDLRSYVLKRMLISSIPENIDILKSSWSNDSIEKTKTLFNLYELQRDPRIVEHMLNGIGKKDDISFISDGSAWLKNLSSEHALMFVDKYIELLLKTVNCKPTDKLSWYYTSRRPSNSSSFDKESTSIARSLKSVFNNLLDCIDRKHQETVLLKYMYLTHTQSTFSKYKLMKKYTVLESLIDSNITIKELFSILENTSNRKRMKKEELPEIDLPEFGL